LQIKKSCLVRTSKFRTRESQNGHSATFGWLSTSREAPLAKASSFWEAAEQTSEGFTVIDRQALCDWTSLLDERYVECLIEVAAVLLADQYGFDVEPKMGHE
jgi:hypothetical protein